MNIIQMLMLHYLMKKKIFSNKFFIINYQILVKTWGITCASDYISPEHLSNLENIFFEKIRMRTLPK